MSSANARSQETRTENRAFVRLKTSIQGKLFLPASAGEQDCTILDISLGGASVACSVAPLVGSFVVLYAEGFDRLPGEIVRAMENGAAILFDATVTREYVAEKVMLYLGEIATSASKTRQSARVPVPAARYVTRENGERCEFEIIDISLTGASFRTKCRPPLGELLTIGSAVGRVVRLLDQGVAVEFVICV